MSYFENERRSSRLTLGFSVVFSLAIHLGFFYALSSQLSFPTKKAPREKENAEVRITFIQTPIDTDQPPENPEAVEPEPLTDSAQKQTKTEFPTPEDNGDIEEKTSEVATFFSSEAPTYRTDQSLTDPDYSGNIFDPRLRKKLEESKSRADYSEKQPEPYSYINNQNEEVFVMGDKCYKLVQAEDGSSATNWSLPSRCSWVKSLSEKMIDNVNLAMKQRREGYQP